MVGKFGENIGVIYIKGLLSLLPLPIEYIFITYTNPSVFDFYFLIGKTVGKYVGKSVAGGRAQRDITICRTARRLQNVTCDVEYEKTASIWTNESRYKRSGGI
jgi:hypothetical protein